jgi:hypothetical protein
MVVFIFRKEKKKGQRGENRETERIPYNEIALLHCNRTASCERLPRPSLAPTVSAWQPEQMGFGQPLT